MTHTADITITAEDYEALDKAWKTIIAADPKCDYRSREYGGSRVSDNPFLEEAIEEIRDGYWRLLKIKADLLKDVYKKIDDANGVIDKAFGTVNSGTRLDDPTRRELREKLIVILGNDVIPDDFLEQDERWTHFSEAVKQEIRGVAMDQLLRDINDEMVEYNRATFKRLTEDDFYKLSEEKKGLIKATKLSDSSFTPHRLTCEEAGAIHGGLIGKIIFCSIQSARKVFGFEELHVVPRQPEECFTSSVVR